MYHYFFKSAYRFPLLGLPVTLIGLWYYWFSTEQIISAILPTLTTGLILLNSVLGFFSYDRHRLATRFLLIVSYVIIGIAFYTLYSLTRGIR